MWGKTDSKIFTIDDATKNHNSVDVDFITRVNTHTVGVNAYFGTRKTNRYLPTPNYGIVNTRYNI